MVLSVNGWAPRVVVSGIGENGRSCVARDGGPLARMDGARAAINNVWELDAVPATVAAMPPQRETYEMMPSSGGVTVIMCAIPPDAEWEDDPSVLEASLAEVGVSGVEEEDATAGLHATNSVDIVTVLSGELTCVLEEDQVLLRAGDVFVQRGTAHAWHNRGTETVVVQYTVIDGSTSS